MLRSLRAFAVLGLPVFIGIATAQTAPFGYEVVPVAGPGESSDKGPAAEALLRQPNSLARDAQGNLYFADERDHRVRRISPDGTISTIAGTGTPGFSGDGGPATVAQLDSPSAVVLDGKGNLYFADRYNLRIRRISQDGTIQTVAGNGLFGWTGDGASALDGSLGFISSLTLDPAGNLYVGDDWYCTVRQVAPAGRITLVAGIPGQCVHSGDKGTATSARLQAVRALAYGQGSNLFIANDCRIRVVYNGTINTTLGNGTCETTGDGGSSNSAHVESIRGLWMDSDFNLYIAQSSRLRKLSSGGIINTLAGASDMGYAGDGGAATSARLRDLSAVVTDDTAHALYLADAGNHRIRRIDASNNISNVAGTSGAAGDGGPATRARLQAPASMAMAPDGSLYFADVDDGRVRRVRPDGTISTVAGNGISGLPKQGVAATATPMDARSIAFDKAGNLYIGSSDGIYRVGADGILRRFAGDGTYKYRLNDALPALGAPVVDVEGMAFDSMGNLYFSESVTHSVGRISADGRVFDVVPQWIYPDFDGDGGRAVDAYLAYPVGLGFDSKGNLYIADSMNARIRVIRPDGIIYTYAGDGNYEAGGDGGPGSAARIGMPTDVKVDALDNVWMTDTSGRRVRVVDAKTLRISTAAAGYRFDQRDGNPMLTGPAGLAASASGDVFVGDVVSHRVVKLTPRTTACAYAVSPATLDKVPAKGQGGTVTVTAGSGCTWAAVSDKIWITLLPPATGSGSGSFEYRIAENTDAVSRSGKITLRDITVAVTQEAGAAPEPTNAPVILSGGVVNAASYQGPIAPFSYVSIYARNLAPGSAPVTWDSVLASGSTSLPQILAGVTVRIGGKPAYVYAVNHDAGVVNVLAPASLPAGPVTVEVTNPQGTSVATVTAQASSPALFTYPLSGRTYAAALFANETTYVAPEGSLPGVISRAAKAGDYVVLYANALATPSGCPEGRTFAPGEHFPIADLNGVLVSLGGQAAKVLYAGMTSTGLWQINIQVPEGVPAGPQAVHIESGNQRAPTGPFLEFR